MDRSTEIGLGSKAGSEETYLLASTQPKKRAGRKKFKETRHPVYRGVRRRGGDKWVCELRNGKSRLWLGTYPAPEMAARAHDVAVLALRGRSACLNFADSAWRLPIPSSASDADIRAAAIEAAEVFRQARQEGASSSSSGLKHEEAVSDAESSSGSADLRAEEDRHTMANERSPENGGAGCRYYLDEEAIFSLPGLLVDMAEGLMVAPPPIVLEESSNHWDGDSLYDSDVSIWNHSTW
ncbi:dehydration-responsive element-binding protein 1D-like [Punica granatum]|uniref:Dehydration-responsive element-binding protein 1D-like n=1 Tax=Punica granatum TaxID=22663 RepID=A0A6P8E7J2_PUNGR|nr:dehydration-responsive element-binding protein 1D-like [Punica granatum]